MSLAGQVYLRCFASLLTAAAICADTCVVTIVNFETLVDYQTASACSAATCPLASAGAVCRSGGMWFILSSGSSFVLPVCWWLMTTCLIAHLRTCLR